MGAATISPARKPLGPKLLRAGAVVLLVAAASGVVLWVAARRCTRPWPTRATVRLEPARPFLTDADVTPDNPFFYLRQLAEHAAILDAWGAPAPLPPPAATAPPKDEMEAMFPSPPPSDGAGERSPPRDEKTEYYENGYVAGAYPILDQRLAAAAPALELLEKAAACGHDGQVPTADGPDSSPACLRPFMEAVYFCCFRIEKRAAAGDWDGVVADTRTVLFCSRQIAKGGPLINHLVTHACTAIVCQSLRRSAAFHPMPAPTTKALIALLAEHEAQAEPFAEALRYELVANYGTIDLITGARQSRLAESPWRAPGPLSQALRVLVGSSNATMKRHAADCYSLVIRDAEMPYTLSPPGQVELDAFLGEPLGWAGLGLLRLWCHADLLMGDIPPVLARMLRPTWIPLALCRGDPLGRALIGLMASGLENRRQKTVATSAGLRCTALSLALRAWTRAHGKPPDDLGQLVPEYFSAVPADPCLGATTKPFIYSPMGQGWRLYSVGPDQIDHGGRYNALSPQPGVPRDQLDVCFHSNEFAPETPVDAPPP
jgi:hypothetical protein